MLEGISLERFCCLVYKLLPGTLFLETQLVLATSSNEECVVCSARSHKAMSWNQKTFGVSKTAPPNGRLLASLTFPFEHDSNMSTLMLVRFRPFERCSPLRQGAHSNGHVTQGVKLRGPQNDWIYLWFSLKALHKKDTLKIQHQASRSKPGAVKATISTQMCIQPTK